MKSIQRERFEKDSFPFLEALWRTALWLTMRSRAAEELVLKTMTEAYRSWNGSVDTVGTKARLFKVLAGEFFDGGNGSCRSDWFLPEQCDTAVDTGNGGGQTRVASIDRQELSLLTRVPDVFFKGAVARLRVQSRLIMILRLRERFSYADISYITGLREDSVKVILRRLRRFIPRYFVQHAGSFVTAANGRTTYHFNRAVSDDGQRRG